VGGTVVARFLGLKAVAVIQKIGARNINVAIKTPTMAMRLSADSPLVLTAAILALLNLIEVFDINVGNRKNHYQHNISQCT
jgi:hypothetical protein